MTSCQYALLTQEKSLIIADLTQYTVIEACGDEAEKYLQGQLTCDVAKLAVGHSTLTANCDPKGKMLSLFRLIRLSPTQFYLLIHKDLLALGLANLKKYAVFSKITFTELNAQIVGIAGEQAQDFVAQKCGQISDKTQPVLQNEMQVQLYLETAQPRYILINHQTETIDFNSDFAQWDLLDIQDGMPLLAAKTQNEFLPQALNLQLLETGISFQKGCYIGQEMVARAKYRGANKRAMFTLAGKTDSLPEIGSEVEMLLETNWRKTGTIISAVNFDGNLWLQVVLNKDIEPNTHFRLPSDESRLCLYPLPYTLEN
ncbi:hypothetical protein EDC44_11138 [Cricetibacter osteomyelitidis]|uniref:Uncharacterized protein n=1 Tax=Cricetibacter osteomyelitidis TaxID=1521931 RepID=A0A4R2TD90_9PAST|nr:tRNA-modifying protein YgfZ [Cricetibacter osteomyelitidis]TCP95088.1 hypothetical protein EDC44_11138 [Cricetibacter osteomyelitidis]